MPALIIHGGAGRPRDREVRDRIALALERIARNLWDQIEAGKSALDVAVDAAVQLEDDALFNAGLGSKLQRDGAARLSAALMDGKTARFSGVVNVEGLLNPIRLCAHLQNERDRVLSGQGALERAQALGLDEGDVRTQSAIDAWQRAIDGETGTIGAIVLDRHGHIAAATSTGGRGMEGIGRVSDSCTVAGNYATQHAGVSCTGIGEDIVDGALAVRLVAAVEAGETIHSAAANLEAQMRQRDWSAGLIGIDTTGGWAAIHTTEIMYWHATDAHGHHRFKDPDDR
jgi:L-asparaginase